jgi:hypothetical protein
MQRGETSGSVVDVEEEREERKAEGDGAWRNPSCDYYCVRTVWSRIET